MTGLSHEITAAKLGALLAELQPDDKVTPNAVRNLAVIRDGAYAGFIDLLADTVEWNDEDPEDDA